MALTVIKVGGSLAAQPNKLRTLLDNLSAFSKSYSLLIVPGGGEFADIVRKSDAQFNLSSAASHRMAILGMDQYGLLLADLLPQSKTVKSFDDVKAAIGNGVLPILLPSQVMTLEDPLENSWDVTSDSIALFIASRLKAEKLLLVTDVDGIYQSDPKQHKKARLITQISPTELSTLNYRTSVDKALPKLLKKWPVTCYVVNGLFPQRIDAILNGEKAPSTLITCTI